MNKAKLGKIIFDVVEDEEFSYSTDVSDYAAEDYNTYVDNVRNKPISLSISGIILEGTEGSKLKLLLEYYNKKAILWYYGKYRFSPCIIKSFSRSSDSTISNGFKFDISLQQIKIAKKQTINFNTSILRLPQIKAKTNNGTQSKKEATTSSINRANISKATIINSIVRRQ